MAKKKLTDTLVQVGVRLPYGLRQKVEAEAKRNGRSVNREVIHCIEAAYNWQEIQKIILQTAQVTADITIQRMAYFQEHGELPPTDPLLTEAEAGLAKAKQAKKKEP